jgi:hypothetical protein
MMRVHWDSKSCTIQKFMVSRWEFNVNNRQNIERSRRSFDRNFRRYSVGQSSDDEYDQLFTRYQYRQTDGQADRQTDENKLFEIERSKPKTGKRSLAVSYLIVSEKLIALSFEPPTEYHLKLCFGFESIYGRRPIRWRKLAWSLQRHFRRNLIDRYKADKNDHLLSA